MPRQKWERLRQSDSKGRRKRNAPKISGKMILTFGKFRGMQLDQVPSDYLLWLAANHADSKVPQVQDVIWWIHRHPKAVFVGLSYE